MAARTELARARELRPRAEAGWRRGFANLLGNEIGGWTYTRTVWVQVAIWVALLNGMLLVPLVFIRDEFIAQGISPLEAGFDMFFSMAAIAPAVGVIILAHGAIITERQLGTAAWVLSKPVSRTAFLMAKFVATGLGILVTALLVPAPVAYAVLSLEHGSPLPAGPFVTGTLVVALPLIFFLAMTLLLNTLLRSRGAVLAVALVALLGADVAIGLWGPLGELGPWLLGRFAVLVAQGHPLPTVWPVITTALWTVAFMALAVWRFHREEF